MSIFESDKITYDVTQAPLKKEFNAASFEVAGYEGPIGLTHRDSGTVIFAEHYRYAPSPIEHLRIYEVTPGKKVFSFIAANGVFFVFPYEVASLTMHYQLPSTVSVAYEAYDTAGLAHSGGAPITSSGIWTYSGGSTGLKTRLLKFTTTQSLYLGFHIEKITWV